MKPTPPPPTINLALVEQLSEQFIALQHLKGTAERIVFQIIPRLQIDVGELWLTTSMSTKGTVSRELSV
jgi:hypothetical protein